MTSMFTLLRLGDLALTLPVAAAIAVWLMAARAWRMAFWWSLLYALGIGLVGASKIAFIGWGAGLPALGFKAISGHATGATAVFPMLFYVLLQGRTRPLQQAGIAAGIGLGLLVGALLLLFEQHSAAEVLAGCALGAAVSLLAIRLAQPLAHPEPVRALLWSSLVFGGAAWTMSLVPVGYWMIKAARILSCNDKPFALAVFTMD